VLLCQLTHPNQASQEVSAASQDFSQAPVSSFLQLAIIIVRNWAKMQQQQTSTGFGFGPLCVRAGRRPTTTHFPQCPELLLRYAAMLSLHVGISKVLKLLRLSPRNALNMATHTEGPQSFPFCWIGKELSGITFQGRGGCDSPPHFSANAVMCVQNAIQKLVAISDGPRLS
jgi:hypothetical protein